jgi:hypothetical protein
VSQKIKSNRRDTHNIGMYKGNESRKQHFDTTDLMAKKLLKKQRADWTIEEDAFLLVCKITSSLLNPQCFNSLCVQNMNTFNLNIIKVIIKNGL